MKRYYTVAFREALYLIENYTALAGFYALIGSLIVFPVYFLFQCSLALAMLPLWLNAQARDFFWPQPEPIQEGGKL